MVPGPWAGDVDYGAALGADPPESCSALAAEHDLQSARKYRCHPPALAAHLRSTDRVHAAKYRMKASDRDPVLDGPAGISERQELKQRDHSVLRSDKRPRPLRIWGT